MLSGADDKSSLEETAADLMDSFSWCKKHRMREPPLLLVVERVLELAIAGAVLGGRRPSSPDG